LQCPFTLWLITKYSLTNMKITHDNEANKLITITAEFADDNAEKYEYLHTKGLIDLDRSESLEDLDFLPDRESPTFLVIKYKNPLRPNVLVKVSRGLKERMQSGESLDFYLDCQFWYYKDANGNGHLRFARPVEFDSEYSLVFSN
jgi:hypothetical protein